MHILTMAQLTFHEARRRKIVAVGLVMGLAFLALFALAFAYLANDLRTLPSNASSPFSAPGASLQMREQGILIFLEFFTFAGLYAVNFLVVMMSILTPVDTLSGEIASGAIQSLVTKPMRRSEIVLGKWLGFFLLTAAYLLLMAGGVILISRLIGGLVVANVPGGLALMLLEAAILLSLSIAGGTRFSTLANGVMCFGLFGLAFIGGWVEQLGALFANQVTQNIGVVISLILPTEAMWRYAAWQMQSPFIRELALTPFGSPNVPSPLMVAWAVGYALVVLLVGIRLFAKRDL